MSYNKATIVGNLGADPDVRYTDSGTAVCNLSVATNRKWKSKSGQMQEEVNWHRVTVFGKTAENCGTYLSKGRQVLVEGRIKYGEYTDKEGVKKYTTEIVAQTVQFLSGGDSDGGGNRGGGGGGGSDFDDSGFDQSFDDDSIPF